MQELSEKNRKLFDLVVRKYFCRVCDYILHKFPIHDKVILHAKVAGVSNLLNASFSDIKFFVNKFSVLVNLFFEDDSIDIITDKLQSQFCISQLENLDEVVQSKRIDTQWSLIGKMKSADGNFKYNELSKIMLAILTIPYSNAEWERIFSLVNKTRTKFRSSISDNTLEKLLLANANLQGNCYEQKYKASFLTKAKSATTVSNCTELA